MAKKKKVTRSKKNPSTSLVRHKIENLFRKRLTKEYKPLIPLETEGIKLDWASRKPPVVCEIYAHVGSLRSAQYKKVMTDALRLIYVCESEALPKSTDKILVFCDKTAASKFEKGMSNWMSSAIKHFGIKIRVEKIRKKLREELVDEQKRQAINFKGKG